jgi:chromosome segregation ATPase
MWKESAREETENLQRAFREHVRELEQMKLERDRLCAAKEERNSRVIEMESLLNHSKTENQKLQDIVKDLNHEINQLSSSHKALSERMGEDSIREQSYLNEIEKLKNSNVHNVKEIDFLQSKVAKLQKEIKESKTDKQSPKKEASEPPSGDGPTSLSDSIYKSELFQVKQINNKRLEEIQRLRSDLLRSLKFMDSELLGLPASREHRSPSKDQSPYQFLNATERFDTINTNLLSPKVALIYERRKLE